MKKNSMKKLTAMALASAMVMSIGGGVSAGTLTAEPESAEKTIGIYGREDGNADGTIDVISVDMVYGAMHFVYKSQGHSTGKWNPKTHEYEDKATPAESELDYGKGWYAEDNSNQISLTNHSNVAVKTAVTHALESSFTDIEITAAPDSAHSSEVLATGDGRTVDEADKMTYTVSIEGTTSSLSTSISKIGSLTVSVEKEND